MLRKGARDVVARFQECCRKQGRILVADAGAAVTGYERHVRAGVRMAGFVRGLHRHSHQNVSFLQPAHASTQQKRRRHVFSPNGQCRCMHTDGSDSQHNDNDDDAYAQLMECAGGSSTTKLNQQITRYLGSTGVVGISVEDVVERATNIKKKIGLTSIESTRLALTIPFISDVDISENGIRVAKLLHSYGVDVAQVLGTQPGLLYVPDTLVQSRLQDLLDAGILPKDLERIITANPAVLCHNVKKDVFRIANCFHIDHDSTSKLYTTIMKALRNQQPLRLIGKSDEARLQTIWGRLKEFQISGWVKHEKFSFTRLLEETSDSIEVKLSLLQERPLCLDVVEQSQFIAEDPQVFVDLDEATVRDRVNHLRVYLGDIRELRETVIRYPALVSNAPWPSAAAYLTDIGVNAATVGTLLVTSPWAVKEMCHPLFASQMQGKVRILSQYLSPARVAAEVGAGKGILLSAPIVQVHMRVKLMERLNQPDFRLAESLRHTSKTVANNLGVSTAYTRYFYHMYKKLLQNLVKSVAVDTALDVKEGMFGVLQVDKKTLFGSVMSPEEFEMQQRVRSSVHKDAS